MSDLDPVHEAIERLEWEDAKQEETPHSRLAAVTRRTALTGGAAGLARGVLAACGGGNEPTSTSKAASAQRRHAGERHLQDLEEAQVRASSTT